MTTLENGKKYELTNKSGAKTVIIIKANIVRAENGASFGTLRKFTSDPRFSSFKIVEVTK